MSKVVERFRLKQINSHLNTNTLVPTHISGCRLDYSTEAALLKLCSDMLNGMEHQEITCLIAMDLTAAFDMVHHNILLNVLSSYYNISNTTLKWITSYLGDRQAYINVHNVESDMHLMDFSVPQGSILGPVLFNCYASTLESHLRLNNSNAPLISYADDHFPYKHFLSNNRQAELDSIRTLEDTLQHVQQWMNLNHLKLNTDKTEFTYVGHYKQLKSAKYKK